MPELLLELFSEEIPARMQPGAADHLAKALTVALRHLVPTNLRSFAGPRRIAVACAVNDGMGGATQRIRGPRTTAPAQSVSGFQLKHGANAGDLREENGYFVLDRALPPTSAKELIAAEIPPMLWRFPWPRAMRWGGSSAFEWVRPLRRILCILGGTVVAFDLRDGGDDGHGLTAASSSEGHRFLSPGAFHVASAAQWQAELRARHVIADAAERRALVAEGIAAKAAEHGLTVVEDAGLLDEVTGLVEWPVPLLGRIDPAYMDLPPEVMQVSMRVNQRYFALRDAAGAPAPWFAFAANVVADDGGAAIIAGNERVLRARFSDARHFWDLDRRTRLADRVPALDAITFHAKLGSQGDRVRRLVSLAGAIAPLVGASVAQTERAALLAKADLTTGMVGEFPELQGIMGRYYALHDGEDRPVADTVRDHYAPRGVDDAVPRASVAIAVALADKLDQLVSFFRVGEKPTGSGDPFALRRAALGVLRILYENQQNLHLGQLLERAGAGEQTAELLEFLKERLRILWRGQGRKHDILEAAFAGDEDRIDDLAQRVQALSALIGAEAGRNLHAGFKRTDSILRIENAKDGPHVGDVDADLLHDESEVNLHQRLLSVRRTAGEAVADRFYETAVKELATLRDPLDRFFERVTVNAPQQDVRRNRLRLLASVVETMNQVADFSKIEG